MHSTSISTRFGVLAVSTLTLFGALACGSGDGGSHPTVVEACTPGATASCTCESGQAGSQTCDPTGGGFGECACAVVVPPHADAGGPTEPPLAEDSGSGDVGSAPEDAGVCGAPGAYCTESTECCQGGSGVEYGALCITNDNECHSLCTSSSQCTSDCCIELSGHPGVGTCGGYESGYVCL